MGAAECPSLTNSAASVKYGGDIVDALRPRSTINK
jgi:hypothetical protein